MAPSAARERANDALENAKRLVLDVRRHLRDWEREGRYPRQAVLAPGPKGLVPPADVGGPALTFPQGMDAFEELGRGDAALAFSISMHNAVAAAVTRKGDPTLRGAWGRRLAAGDAPGGVFPAAPPRGPARPPGRPPPRGGPPRGRLPSSWARPRAASPSPTRSVSGPTRPSAPRSRAAGAAG